MPRGYLLAKPARLSEAPLILTQSVRDISVTERNGFKSCRRRWYLDTLENLEPRGAITWYYEFGTGLHTGLEAYYKVLGGIHENQDIGPLEAALEAFEKWYTDLDKKIAENFADAAAVYRDELLEYKTLGTGMLENYHLFAQAEDTFVVCCVEGNWTPKGLELLGKQLQPPYSKGAQPILHEESGRFLTPIINPATGRVMPGHPYLSARLDLVVYERRSGWKGFWVSDHKSSTGVPSDRGVDMDDQVTGYDYVFWRHTGIIPRGTFFNYLIKQLPKMPRIVRDGQALSYAKDQLTHADLYWEALKDFKLINESGKITSASHQECYDSLRAFGWSRFFTRMRVTRNEHELKMFELRLVEELRDMRAVYKDPARKAYPHLSQYNCPGCQMAPICQAIEDGSDYENVIKTRFQPAEDRKAA